MTTGQRLRQTQMACVPSRHDAGHPIVPCLDGQILDRDCFALPVSFNGWHSAYKDDGVIPVPSNKVVSWLMIVWRKSHSAQGKASQKCEKSHIPRVPVSHAGQSRQYRYHRCYIIALAVIHWLMAGTIHMMDPAAYSVIRNRLSPRASMHARFSSITAACNRMPYWFSRFRFCPRFRSSVPLQYER